MEKIKQRIKNKVSRGSLWLYDNSGDLIILMLLLFIARKYHWLYYLILGYYLIVKMVLLYMSSRTKKLSKEVMTSSTLIFGHKGKGKDLSTQAFVNNYYRGTDKSYISNMDYGHNKIDFEYKYIDLSPNDFENMINGDTQKIKKYEPYENKNLLLSDLVVYFPNVYDGLLSKKYKSMPLFMAISRHLYKMNIIANTQDINRPWKKIKEHFDLFVKAKKTTGILLPILHKYKFVSMTLYENFGSAEQGMQTFSKSGIISRDNPLYSTTADTLRKQYYASNGRIEDYTVLIPKNEIQYDTRHFHKLFYGEEAPQEKRRKFVEVVYDIVKKTVKAVVTKIKKIRRT